ncbi:ATP-binding protein [Spirulina sp. 06S082]|uniref:ATP-binding protein n=1 Tax=Spirulina sp. 06S082 TaxID=3110248 RepID=UPI002B1F00B6|nr:ATP-binding protein [Spirulina sp. 06S082]MEA5472038.1 ATP-binding protein [Spirulina sp. 06S082]
MAKSFRRILLSRLLMLSVPTILLGVSTTYFVTYRKARSGLLETARQNLTESAVRRGKEINDTVDALKANMVTASNTTVLRNGDRQQYRQFLTQLSKQLPTQIECVQLIDTATKENLESTCTRENLVDFSTIFPSQQAENGLLPLHQVDVQILLPSISDTKNPNTTNNCQEREININDNPLRLTISVPIYNTNQQLNSLLVVRSLIIEPTIIEPGSLSGSTAIINQEGKILVHPCSERVGGNIELESDEDAGRLQAIIKKVQDGEKNFIHLFSFEKKGSELLAGYAGIPSPLSDERGQTWVVLTMTPLQDALAALGDIQRVLLNLLSSLTLVLILGTIAIILYVSREMARPLEALRNHVINQDPLQSQDPIPHNFTVHEFNQLARAFNDTIDHIRDSYSLVNRTLENAMRTATDLKAAEARLQESLESEKLANERLERATEKLQKSLKAERLAGDRLREVLRLISDQFGNPLNGVIGNLDLLRIDLEDGLVEAGEENEELELAYKSAIKLYERLNKISKMFSIADNNFFADIQSVHLNKILQNISEEYYPKIQEKGLDFDFQIGEYEDIIIFADPDKLKEVIASLIDNAMYHTHTGQISLKTHVESVEESSIQEISSSNNNAKGNSFYVTGQRACIIIQDTGSGMSPEEIESHNNPQNKRTTTGLSIVTARILMEIMDGHIFLSSEGKGMGTSVQFCLPTAKRYDIEKK